MSKKERALPFEVDRGFTAMPNAVSDYYTMHPLFTGAAERLYLFLLRKYNAKEGYAYPSYQKIREHTKINSDSTVSRSIQALEHLGLIRVEKVRLDNGNISNRYYFEKPIEDYEEFMRKFGDELPKKYRERLLEFDAIIEWF